MSKKPTYEELEQRFIGLERAEFERNSALDALRESEARYRELFVSNPHPMWVYDLETLAFLAINNAAISHYGYSRDEFLSMTIKDIRPAEDVPRLMGNVDQVSDGLDKAGIWRHIKKDKRVIEVEITSHVLLFDKRRAEMVLAHDITERKRSEEALRESENRYRAVYELISDYAYSYRIEPDGQLVNEWTTGALIHVTGYSRKELQSLGGWEFLIHPDDIPIAKNQLQALLSNKKKTVEYRMITKNGQVRWMRDYARPAWNATERRVTHIEGAIQDITERKQVEEAVRESEEKYRDLADSLPQIVFETDATGNLTYVNQNAFDLFGYTQAELDKGLNTLKMIIPKEHDRALENIQTIMNGKILGGVEYTALRKNGTRFPVVIHSKRVMRDNKPMGLRGLIIDYSKIKKMEMDLKGRAMAMDQSIDTIVITDTKGLITYVNPAFEKTTGYSQEEALGKNPRILQSGKHDEMFYHELWQSISEGKTWSGRFVNKKKDGAQFTEEATISPVFSDQGKIVNYVAVKRDISDKLKLEAHLQQAQKMEAIGNLAGGIAHDFNNILSPIFGYTELLMMDASDNSQLRQGLTHILAGAKTAKNLVNQILTFSRQREHEMKPLNVQRVIKEDLELVRSSLPATIDICEDISNDCGLVLADPTQIQQIIMNLCTNAYHAMEETGGKLTVNLKAVELAAGDLKDPDMVPGRHVCLTVADTGLGMDQSIIARIFDPYFTTKDKDKGTGLGLAIIHGIVNSHNGHISVYSEPGKGTEFHVYLPVIKAIQEAAQVEIQSIQKGNERILLVDDKKDVADIEQQMLTHLGYHVTTRTSSPDALAAFRTNPDNFDLVITDLTMPNMTGDELAGELIKIRSDIPVILCTGFSEGMSKEKAVALGVKGFLMKPIVIKDLSKIIRNILDNKIDA